MWAVALMVLLAPGYPALAGHFPKPGDGSVVLKSGTYTIDGEEVRIQIEVAREKGFDGPVTVACAISGCANPTVKEVAASSEAKPSKDMAVAVGSTDPRLSWKNADRAPKTLSFTVPRKEFFANSKGIEVSLHSPQGAHLGETLSLAAIPAGAREQKGPEIQESRRAVADASDPRRLILNVRENNTPAPAETKTGGKAVADTIPPNGGDPAL